MSTKRRLARCGIVGLVVLALGSSIATPASARGAVRSPGLTMTYEYDKISTWSDLRCYHEDSMHDRWYEGSLDPGQSFTVALPFCDYERDGTTPGGTGFLIAATARAAFSLTAKSASGRVREAHLMPPNKGKEYRRGCVNPPIARTDGVIIGTIEGGTWTVTITNPTSSRLSGISLQVYVDMAPRSWQESWCPQADWSST